MSSVTKYPQELKYATLDQLTVSFLVNGQAVWEKLDTEDFEDIPQLYQLIDSCFDGNFDDPSHCPEFYQLEQAVISRLAPASPLF